MKYLELNFPNGKTTLIDRSEVKGFSCWLQTDEYRLMVSVYLNVQLRLSSGDVIKWYEDEEHGQFEDNESYEIKRANQKNMEEELVAKLQPKLALCSEKLKELLNIEPFEITKLKLLEEQE